MVIWWGWLEWLEREMERELANMRWAGLAWSDVSLLLRGPGVVVEQLERELANLRWAGATLWLWLYVAGR